MQNENPYSAPRSALSGADDTEPHYGDATKGQRIANLFLDYIGFILMSAVIGLVLGIVGAESILDALPDQVFGVILMFAYYAIFESRTGRTPGKLLTGTKVVMEDGTSPSTATILKRSAVRFIPFEPFSFLGSTDRGWHDTWTRTRVVRLRPQAWQREA